MKEIALLKGTPATISCRLHSQIRIPRVRALRSRLDLTIWAHRQTSPSLMWELLARDSISTTSILTPPLPDLVDQFLTIKKKPVLVRTQSALSPTAIAPLRARSVQSCQQCKTNKFQGLSLAPVNSRKWTQWTLFWLQWKQKPTESQLEADTNFRTSWTVFSSRNLKLQMAIISSLALQTTLWCEHLEGNQGDSSPWNEDHFDLLVLLSYKLTQSCEIVMDII